VTARQFAAKVDKTMTSSLESTLSSVEAVEAPPAPPAEGEIDIQFAAAPEPEQPVERPTSEACDPPTASPEEAPAIAGAPAELTAMNDAIAPDTLQPVRDSLQNLTEQLAQIGETINTKLMCDSHQQKIIDRLHQELQEQKQGFVLKLLEPIAKDRMQVADDFCSGVLDNRAQVDEPGAARRLLNFLEACQMDVEAILERYGFEPFSNDADMFDASCQRVSRRIVTTDVLQDRKIAHRLGRGYRYNGVMIRPELVAVYRLESSPATSSS